MMTGSRPATVERIIRFWAIICAVLVLALGATVIALVKVTSHRAEQRTSDRIRQAQLHTQAEIQGSCDFWRYVATAPLEPDTKPLGLDIVAGVRIAYAAAECPGKLPPADPRVRALLPPGVR